MATASIAIMKSGPAKRGDADRRAGRGRHPKITHADVGALLELVEIGDKGVGLDNVGPAGAGCLETSVEVPEGLFHLRPHVLLPTQLPSTSRANWPAV
jgi:hypothetical protein